MKFFVWPAFTLLLIFFVTAGPGDVNGDNQVNMEDMLIIINNLGVEDFDARADVNEDGVVDLFDLVIVARHFGAVYDDLAPPGLHVLQPEGEQTVHITITCPETTTLCQLRRISPLPHIVLKDDALYEDTIIDSEVTPDTTYIYDARYWIGSHMSPSTTRSITLSTSETPPTQSTHGACGSRATTYNYDVTSWPASSEYCSQGTTLSTPSFPSQGESVSWECQGSNGGTNASCTATRQSAPPPSGGATPILYDDFSGYASRSELTDPSHPNNPWTHIYQDQAYVPGEFVYLDTNPPPGSINGVTMRYNHYSISECSQNVGDTGGGARYVLEQPVNELWLDTRVYPQNWSGSVCGFFGYKLFFFNGPWGEYNYGRSDINWVNEGLQGSIGPGRTTTYLGAGPGEDFSYFVNRWTRIRVHVRVPSQPDVTNDGRFRVWIDDELVADYTSETGSMQQYESISAGANLNNMLLGSHAYSHWDYIALYTENPGWE